MESLDSVSVSLNRPRKDGPESWYDIGRRNRRSIFGRVPSSQDGANNTLRRFTLTGSSLAVASVPRPVTRLNDVPLRGGYQLSSERMKTLSSELKAKGAERNAKLKSWSAQIQTKEDILVQLKASLRQLQVIDGANFAGSPNGLSPAL